MDSLRILFQLQSNYILEHIIFGLVKARGMWHAQVRRNVYTEFWWGISKDMRLLG
jgi:hypothetical protein